jgi:uncharacterized membrane protein YcaP (DUF421 family)
MTPSDIPHPPLFFESWYNVGRTASLAVIGFAALIVLLRVSGKRTLSKMNVFDFVFVVAVGSVFASTIISKDVTLVEGLAGLIALVGFQAILAKIAAHSPRAARLINGDPALLLSKGKFIHSALRKERITEEEVRASIRAKGINRVEDVDAVVIENDGTLSVAWEAKGPGHSSLVDAEAPGERNTQERGKRKW